MGGLSEYNPNLFPENFQARSWKRIINYLIDLCLIIAGSLFVFICEIDKYGFSTKYGIVIFFSCFLLYYTISEYFFGKTIGKYISRTEVVDEKFKRPSFIKILKRTLCRFIPFDPFSTLTAHSPMHDSLTKTIVVNSERKKIA